MDHEAVSWLAAHRVDALDSVFVGLGWAGYAGLLWIAIAPVVARAAAAPVLMTTALTAVTVWAADLIALGVKELVGRARPFETLPDVDPLMGAALGASFPSGHAATSFAGAVFLSFVLPRVAPYLVLLAVAIAFSRVYVGVHYPTDVLAGAALGATVGLAGAKLSVRALRRPSGSPPRRAAPPPPG